MFVCFSCSPRTPVEAPKNVSIAVGGHRVTVELALDEKKQMRGLMFREYLCEDEGMLFVYPSPRPLSFWMKNTPLPLSIAFIDAHGTIVKIEDMKPFDEVSRHRSGIPVQYALEMKKGWFARNGVGVGDRVEIPGSVHDRRKTAVR
jgi:uncharacterized membrane protein (UPF0127 family)